MTDWVIGKKPAIEHGNQFMKLTEEPSYYKSCLAGGYRWVSSPEEATHFQDETEASDARSRSLGYIIESWIVKKLS